EQAHGAVSERRAHRADPIPALDVRAGGVRAEARQREAGVQRGGKQQQRGGLAAPVERGFAACRSKRGAALGGGGQGITRQGTARREDGYGHHLREPTSAPYGDGTPKVKSSAPTCCWFSSMRAASRATAGCGAGDGGAGWGRGPNRQRNSDRA